MTDCILVSFDKSEKDSRSVLIIGRRRINESTDIINAFQGEEAEKLYKRLITRKENQKK